MSSKGLRAIKAAAMVLMLVAIFLPETGGVTATPEPIGKTAPQEQGTYVYTNNDNDTNASGGPNSVTAFSVGATGALTKIADYNTFGEGFGGGYFGASRIVVCAASNRLYVANDWSNNISGFDINPATGVLSIVTGSPFPSGVPYEGITYIGISLACTPDGKFLMVGNAWNLAVLSIATNGSLTPIPGSPFGPFSSKILGMKVTADGRYLFAGSAPGFQMFSIAADGTPTFLGKTSATGGIGVDINCAGTLGYGAISINTNTRVAGCSIGTNGVPVLLPGSPFTGSGGSEEASSTVLLSADERFLFVSNAGSTANPPFYSMTVFDINGAGALIQSSTVLYQSGHDGRQIGLATNAAGTLLFAAELHRGTVGDSVGVYNIGANGVLTEVADSPFPTGILLGGLESLAVFPPRACCLYGLSATEEQFPETGGSATVDVTAPGGCAWTAVSNAPSFIAITSGSPGSGNGTVSYTVAANSGLARTGTMTIAGITFTVTQDEGSSCTFTLDRVHQSFTGNGGNGTVNVTASDPGCTWIASTTSTFVHITSGSSGTGSGGVQYSVDVNPATTVCSDTITIAGHSFTVYQGINFADVPPTALFYNEIGKLSARGVTLGCGNGNYCPNDEVLRDQMAAFIMRAKGEFNPPTPLTQRFVDVSSSNVFYNFIDRLAELQITLGCTPTMYCPSDPVKREQMAAFLIRGLGEFNPPMPGSQRFTDVPPENPFYRFIDRMAVLQITLGCSPTMYCPSDTVTRAQMAAFLVRAFNL